MHVEATWNFNAKGAVKWPMLHMSNIKGQTQGKALYNSEEHILYYEVLKKLCETPFPKGKKSKL